MNDTTVYFSPPEEEIIASLQEMYGATYLEACERVVLQKRELAFVHQQRGNYELAKTILKELGEWNAQRQEEYEQAKSLSEPKKIILLP